jgi:hypothetical protein
MSWTERPHPAVTVLAGSERLDVRGPAALLIGMVARHAERINRIAIGRVVAHLANQKVHLEFRESSAPIRIEE